MQERPALPYEFAYKRARSILLIPVLAWIGVMAMAVAIVPEATCAFIDKPADCFDERAWFLPRVARAVLLIPVGVFSLALSAERTIDLLKQRTLKVTTAGIAGRSPLVGAWFIPWQAITKLKDLPGFLYISTTPDAQTPRWFRLKNGGYTFLIPLMDFDFRGADLAGLIRRQRPDL
jgi:hypothetical protein